MIPRWLVCVAFVASLSTALSAHAVDYFWQNSSGGSFLEPSNWQPFAPPGTQGPGGANDTVNFDLGVAATSRYLLTDLSGQNDQLIVHNDSVELSVFLSYTLRSAGGTNPSLVVGAASGDTADVVFSGAEILETKVTRIGNVAGSTGTVTVEGLRWNGENLRVGYAGTGQLTIDDDATIESENVSIGHLDGSTGRLNFIGDGTLTTTGNLLVGRAGNGSLTLTFNGTMTSANVSIGSEATGDGNANVSGQFTAWTIQGTLTVGEAGDAELDITSGRISNANAVVGDLPGSDGFVHVSGGEWTTTGRLTVGGQSVGGTSGGSGLFRISSGDVTVDEEIVISTGGIVDFQGGLLTAEEVTVQTGGQFDWTDGLLDVDQFNGNLVNQGGSLVPQQNTMISGNYTQQAAGTFAISILGEAASNLYDSVDVTGTASLGGEFVISAATFYEPSSTEVYPILRAGNIVGSFDNVASGERLAGGRGSYVVYYGLGSPFDPDHVVVTDFQPAGLPGDYNGDGVVDAADYVVWRKNDGTQSGYNAWRANFGRTSGAISAGSFGANIAVPEANSLLLSAIAVALLCGHATSRRDAYRWGSKHAFKDVLPAFPKQR